MARTSRPGDGMTRPHPSFFSIIVPSYNYAHCLPRVLDSVFSQGGDDYEIIVVDDGSTDNTADVMQGYMTRADGRLIYVRQENRGPSAARNHGIALATGRYVLFVDADDVLLPGALDRFRTALATRPSLDYALGGYLLVRIDGRVKHRPALKLGSRREENFARYLHSDLNIICCGCLVVHRRVFDRIRFPGSDIMWEDIIFNAQLLALYDGIAFPDPVARIIRHTDSLGHNQARIKREYRKPLDLLFDPSVLPPRLMTMHDEFLSIICLQQFTFLYKRGYYGEAKALYGEAIRAYPRHLLKLQPLRRYLSIRVGWKRQKEGRLHRPV